MQSFIQGEQDRTEERTNWIQDQDKKQLESHKPGWVTALSQAWASNERTVDLDSLGIDLGVVFDGLLSPEGIVNQYALSIAIQLMFLLGYIVTGEACLYWDILLQVSHVYIVIYCFR